MFQQDYIMRQIEYLGIFLARLLLDSDLTVYETLDENTYVISDDLFKRLMSLLELGKINEAENLLFDTLDPQQPRQMEIALAFYRTLNRKDDAFLEANDFSREEIYEGLSDVSKLYGITLPDPIG